MMSHEAVITASFSSSEGIPALFRNARGFKGSGAIVYEFSNPDVPNSNLKGLTLFNQESITGTSFVGKTDSSTFSGRLSDVL